ncbi:MAG: DNA polymerase III subunit alpha [Flavobacteriaceae bacterium]
MYLIFDTETTGLPRNWSAPITDTDNWPRCVQIAWQLHDAMGNVVEHQDYLIKPDGFNIPFDSERVHGISTELALEQGIPLQEVLEKFNIALSKAKFVVGHNVGFDLNVMGCEFHRYLVDTELNNKPILDTCTEDTAELLKLPGGRGGRFKLPTLTELYQFLFQESFSEAHNATADVEATTRAFLELIRKEFFTKEELDVPADYFRNFKENNPTTIQLIGLKHINLKAASDQIRKQATQAAQGSDSATVDVSQITGDFVHLHNHTQFSVLQSTISVSALVAATAKNKMKAVAMTDIGNMMGAFQFVSKIEAHNKSVKAKNAEIEENGGVPTEVFIKPIVGCQLFVCENHLDKSRKDNGYQVVFLAKNKKGYHNLAKMSSIAYTKGFYYVPRIDRSIIEQYKEDIIVLSGNLYGEIPSKILNIGEAQAEEALLWWKEKFGDDFYLELMRHGQQDEDVVNKTLIEFSKKHQVKLVATNNTFYVNQEDANAHDILLCVKDAEKQATPKGRGRGYRYGLDNSEYYFKSEQQMKALFADIPEAINNIDEIVNKVEAYSLYRDVLLPKFDIPEEFLVEEDKLDGGKRGENKYLRHLTYVGAEKRYKEITDDIRERLDFELQTIEKTGYPGYFLIVQDFIAAAREMGVSVGPGRGSAAGSAVAYCLGITNIDPIEYDLLFERFLNPDRVSMPDIDIDFDDEGRGRVMQYVIDKYGQNQVAQIITYGTMAAKSSIRDTARVLDLPLFEADKVAKLIPNMSLAKIFSMEDDQLKKALRSDEFEKVIQLKELANSKDLTAETIKQAKMLEGSLRNTGIHACGVIITPDDISNFVPIANAKDSELNVTQFDNSVAESAGLLKMDFLGLKTLTLIKDTVKLVKYTKNIDLDPDNFPIDDKKTYELFQRGETVGIFQYESPGMQKYMRELKPTVFADLIAMNALYRPGPLEYIPSFIRRKNGEEEIKYDLDAMEEYLSETYGITVYQEQVMLLSQKLADFSKGDADVLRKAMGKKQKDVLDKMKPRFIERASAKGHDPKILEKVWKDWEAFASYAFNKSHSTCYAWIAYQTAYLKAHYPSEYMAAVLSNNMNDIKSVTFFMEECKRMGIEVLPPDVNESFYKFTVNERNAIRFGMGAVKNVGSGAVQTIVDTRKDGKYKSVFDLARRVDLRSANKKAFENLALAGGFDCFTDTHRAQYFTIDTDGISFLEKVIRYGAKYQENENSAQVSLFGDSSEVQIPEPVVPAAEEWGAMEKLAREKEVVGIYISGHPLDNYKYELKYFCNTSLNKINDLNSLIGKQMNVGGIITNFEHKIARNGKGWGIITLEDYDGSYDFRFFGEDYLKFKMYFNLNQFTYMKFTVKEGWINKETGKRGEPIIQVLQMQYLQDVLSNFSKNLIIKLSLSELENDVVEKILDVFRKNKGNNSVSFEIFEIDYQEKEPLTNISLKPQTENLDLDELEDYTESEDLEIEEEITLPDEVKVLNHLALDSRNMKINICKELLDELEKHQINFMLN